MAKRRSRGDGGLHWDEKRQRWIATASLGFSPAGKRIVKRTSGITKTTAKAKLKEILRDHEDGLAIAPTDYTVKEAVTDWLTYGLNGRVEKTITTYKGLCDTHLIPQLGARKLRDLNASDVDKWLTGLSTQLSTRTLQTLRSCLNRSVDRAMARDLVKRNIVMLCEVPQGRAGRPSKALTFPLALAILTKAEGNRIYPYIVLSLLTGARTEELRALTWDHVFLEGRPNADPPEPPHMAVWRSVRKSGDTKTRKSRRTLALPQRCIDVLQLQRRQRDEDRERVLTGTRPRQGRWKGRVRWQDSDLVFATRFGTPLDAARLRRDFRAAIKGTPGLVPQMWTPRELRHSFVSLLSDSGMPLEQISQLVGHKTTTVTETVYRKQLRPVIQHGAVAMDRIFADTEPPPETV